MDHWLFTDKSLLIHKSENRTLFLTHGVNDRILERHRTPLYKKRHPPIRGIIVLGLVFSLEVIEVPDRKSSRSLYVKN